SGSQMGQELGRERQGRGKKTAAGLRFLSQKNSLVVEEPAGREQLLQSETAIQVQPSQNKGSRFQRGPESLLRPGDHSAKFREAAIEGGIADEKRIQHLRANMRGQR